MVSKLGREFVEYKNLLMLRKTLTAGDVSQYQEKEWSELILLEEKRSSLLTDQSKLQEEIITALISGDGVQSSTVQKPLTEAGEIAELLTVYDQNIDEIRKSLLH